jgi:hypothetical protein
MPPFTARVMAGATTPGHTARIATAGDCVMPSTTLPARFWVRWLLGVSAGLVAFGLVLVVFPTFATRGFSLLVYADAYRIEGFGTEAARYASLAHAVIGGLMIGWGVALFLLVRGSFAAGQAAGWRVVAFSLLAWFVPDTAYSLWSGFWQNAALNAGFLLLFGIPLLATFGWSRARDA